MRSLPSAVVRGALASLTLIACFAAGCSSDDRPARGSRDRPPRMQVVPTMVGRETFFAGRIIAEVRVGAMAGFDRSGDGESGGPREGRPRRGGGGGGGFTMGGGIGGAEGRMGGGPGGREGTPAGGEDGRPASGQRLAMATNAPPVAIHLRFTNTGSVLVDLQIVDFLSPLGNFVVHPPQLKLEPGQSLEVEPMASRLGGDTTAAEVSLALRLEGTDESKKVILQPEAVAKPADTPPGPSN
jgi:hypothetical protein